MTLDHLAPKIIRRDERAFAELYERTRRIVYSVCLSILKNRAVAEELSQDTFVAVWERIDEFRGNGLKLWVLTTAKHKALNELRRRKREVAVDFFENETIGGEYIIETQVEEGLLLSVALGRLNEVDRQIVLMKNSGAKTKEIAEFLQMPRGTVSWRYAEALKVLRNYVEVEG